MPKLFIFLVLLFAAQLACNDAGVGRVTNSVESNAATPDGILPTPEHPPYNNRERYLSQNELKDVAKLIDRYQNATENDKTTAQSLYTEAQKLFAKEKFTTAAEGFAESLLIYPTVEALVMYGEAIAHLKVSEQPKNERLQYKKDQFADAIDFFKLAQEFAKRTEQSAALANFPKLDEHLGCLQSFLTNDRTFCSYITAILFRRDVK